ncbi:MAG: PAS domain S-box protein [Rhizomicrobium sp.]|jgi:two-component system sensor kinase FixL
MDRPAVQAPGDAQSDDSLFQTLIATAVDGIMVIDERAIVQIYNNACERLFQYRAEEIVGQNVKMLMPAPYRDEHDSYLDRYKRTGQARIIGIGREVQGRRKDGSVFPMLLSVGAGRLGSKPIFVGIVHDITERKSAEARLQLLQDELNHVGRLTEMSHFSAALAHELNQPLAAIMNYMNVAKRLLASPDAGAQAKAKEALVKAGDQAERAGSIIRRLRDFVEKRDGKRTVENINAIAEDAIALGLVGAKLAGIRLRTEFAPNSPPVLVDRVQIQQVMVNLLRNASEAMAGSAKRELTITTAGIDGSAVEVAVADTGPGIPEEVASRLFKPFITTKAGGMGIGLAISHSIVEAHGGRLRMTPNHGGGAVFRFQLPAAPATE